MLLSSVRCYARREGTHPSSFLLSRWQFCAGLAKPRARDSDRVPFWRCGRVPQISPLQHHPCLATHSKRPRKSAMLKATRKKDRDRSLEDPGKLPAPWRTAKRAQEKMVQAASRCYGWRLGAPRASNHGRRGRLEDLFGFAVEWMPIEGPGRLCQSVSCHVPDKPKHSFDMGTLMTSFESLAFSAKASKGGFLYNSSS